MRVLVLVSLVKALSGMRGEWTREVVEVEGRECAAMERKVFDDFPD